MSWLISIYLLICVAEQAELNPTWLLTRRQVFLQKGQNNNVTIFMSKNGHFYAWSIFFIKGHCMLGNFACFFLSFDFSFFQTNFLKKKSFRTTIRVSNGLDPNQAHYFGVLTVCKSNQPVAGQRGFREFA